MSTTRVKNQRNRKAQVAALVATLLIAVIAAIQPASANYLVGYTGNSGCTGLNMMDQFDSTVHYKRFALRTDNYDGVGWGMAFAVHPTDLDAVSTSSSTTADVIFYDGNYSTYCGYTWWTSGSGGTGAIATCHTLSGSGCAQHRIYIGNEYSDELDTTEHRILACHETGHAIGLTHNSHSASSNSCLRSSVLSGGGTTYYSSHETNDSINFQW